MAMLKHIHLYFGTGRKQSEMLKEQFAERFGDFGHAHTRSVHAQFKPKLAGSGLYQREQEPP